MYFSKVIYHFLLVCFRFYMTYSSHKTYKDCLIIAIYIGVQLLWDTVYITALRKSLFGPSVYGSCLVFFKNKTRKIDWLSTN